MTNHILRFVKNVACSRVGQLFVVIHLVLVVLSFAGKPPIPREQINGVDGKLHTHHTASLLAGRSLHFNNEPLEIKLLTFLDSPGIILGIIISLPLIPIDLALPPYESSWFNAIMLLIGTSIQWILIGYFVERLISYSSRRQA